MNRKFNEPVSLIKKFTKAIYNFSLNNICGLLLLITLYLSFNRQVANNQWTQIIRADGVGYYSYLPAVFIYQKYDFSFLPQIAEKYNHDQYSGGFLTETSHGKMNKYYIGLSILWMPFFLIAHFLSLLFGYSADGYSQIYQLSILAATNFYFWLGCRYIRKLILAQDVSKGIAALILLLIAFGTNLYHYITFDSWASHVCSFAVISIFLYQSYSFFNDQQDRKLYLIAFLLGLIILLRPTNVTVILMFIFFAASFKNFMQMIMTHKAAVFKSALIVACILSLQFVYYYLESGYFFVWSYGGETFDFTDPQIFNVLFSYRKGLFVYTPLFLIGLFGLIYLFKRNKFQLLIAVLFFSLSIYIISSWSCWWYGCSLGQRPFVDYYSILALFLGFLYLSMKNVLLRSLFFLMSPLCIIYSLVLSYQYQHFIIHAIDTTKEKFWLSFMKTDERYEGLVWSDAFFHKEEPFNPVSFKALTTNKYVGVKGDTSGYVLAGEEKLKAWETFNLVNLDGGKVAFRAANDKYLSLHKNFFLKYAVDRITDDAKFELQYAEDDIVYIKASNNRFVKLKNDTLDASAEDIKEAERFKFRKLL